MDALPDMNWMDFSELILRVAARPDVGNLRDLTIRPARLSLDDREIQVSIRPMYADRSTLNAVLIF